MSARYELIQMIICPKEVLYSALAALQIFQEMNVESSEYLELNNDYDIMLTTFSFELCYKSQTKNM